MKKILVTGVNSYVGNRFAEWIEQYPDDYDVDRISVRDDKWKDIDLSIYDSILHVAGIAHQKETKENEELYYQVNRDLTQELALKAKEAGVIHFVFLSTMSVYGLDEGIIDQHTLLKPKTHYGKSKLEAETFINELADESFKVAILRPPMIYGKRCKGNYQRLRNLVLKIPVFPKINNQRSMIYIDNLSEFIRLIIAERESGVFCPQNKEYVNTTELVKYITQFNNKKLLQLKIFNPLLNLIKVDTITKVFGNLIYEKSSFKYKYDYHLFEFHNSIKVTEQTESVANEKQ